MDTRGVDDGALVEGARRSSLNEFADWTLWAYNVVSF
jgi:sulfur relay (sulfurtransferase) complex TusBCD TusD component (DsrE family)